MPAISESDVKELFQQTDKRFTTNPRIYDRTIPKNLWVKCPACRQLMYAKQLNDNLKVCVCGHHMRMGVRERLFLLDAGTFEEEDTDLAPRNLLGCASLTEHCDPEVIENHQQLPFCVGVISGCGMIGGYPVGIVLSDMAFSDGSIGTIFGEKITRAIERAATRGLPLLTMNVPGILGNDEGIIELMQMAKINFALTRLAAAGQPHFSLIVDPCLGGITASYAAMADLIIAEPGANILSADGHGTKRSFNQTLPPHTQIAEFLLRHGMIDMIVPRSALRRTLAVLLRLYAGRPKDCIFGNPVLHLSNWED
jgi:acetyl-CoA carboxylase carboxyl transferase subunit beta